MAELATFVVLGLAAGSIYGLAATGLVLSYTTSGVFNLAYGAVGALGAFVFYDLLNTGVPWPVALVGCTVVGGTAVGVVLEPFMRTLSGAPVHLRIVATVGLMLVIQGFITWHWGTEPRFVTSFLPTTSMSIGDVRIGADQLILLSGGAVVTAGLAVLLRLSSVGTTLRAVVDDPQLLAETGRNPDRFRRLAWCTGSALSIASGIVLAPTIGLDAVLLTFVVVQAFGAAALGRFRNLERAYLGGLLIGVVGSLAARYVGTYQAWVGVPAVVPFAALYLALVVGRTDQQHSSLRPPMPVRGRQAAAVGGVAALTLVALAIQFPSRLPVFTAAAGLTVVFMGLALLVNLSGQVSLGHAALAAVGGATMAHLGGSPAMWPVALLLAGLVSAVVGVLATLPSLRLTGLPLALATFAFGLGVARLVYPMAVMFGISGERDVGRPEVFGLGSDHGYFAVALAVAGASTLVLHRVDRGTFGRMLRAMGDHPDGVASLGVPPLLLRAAAFGVASFFAGIGGALLVVTNETASAAAFDPTQSLLWVAVLVLGGTGVVVAGIRGALAASLIPYFLEPVLGGDELLLLFGLAAMVAATIRSRAGGRIASAAGTRVASPWAEAAEWRLRRSPVAARMAVR